MRLAILWLTLGLGTTMGETVPKVLFEAESVNFAWGYHHQGWYIDGQGNIYRYEFGRNDAVWEPKDPDVLTEAELLKKYEHGRKQAGKIAPDVLAAKSKLISQAAAGKLSTPQRAAFDMGTRSLLAYLYDPFGGTYRKIVLQITGDKTQSNGSLAAQELVKWMESVRAAMP
jgi:hypothetical protein